MEHSQTRHDKTGRVAMTVAPDRELGASSPMTPSGTGLMTSIPVCTAGDITRQALQLASSALQIDLAWHAGMVSAEAAMECLHNEIGETVRRRNASTRAGSPGAAEFFQSPGTPTGLGEHIR